MHELGLSARNLVAAGDAENDHALLDAAEYSVAVANAIPTLMEAADRVTKEKRGDGILEVIADLIDHDLVKTPPRRERRAISLGREASGSDVMLPPGVSMLVTGGHGSGKSSFTRRVLERLCTAGYQFCVLDGRGEYLDFQPAVVFGTQENPPDVFEILTALEKPDVQAVVCLAAVLPAKRAAFFEKLHLELKALREKTGRPHWLVIDEAQELVPRMEAATLAEEGPDAENAIYVTSDPSAIDARILESVHVVAVRGPAARQSLEGLAALLPSDRPPEPLRAPAESEALVWIRNGGKAPQLVTLPSRTHPDRAIRNDVGRLLRRA